MHLQLILDYIGHHKDNIILASDFDYVSRILKADRNNFDESINSINNANKPLIYLGQGCVNSSIELREFAKKGNIPVVSTIHGCGIFDEDDSLSLQWCGMHGNAARIEVVQEADCIIALGLDLMIGQLDLLKSMLLKLFQSLLKKVKVV